MTADAVVAINRELLAGAGEPHALIDRGLLESACQRPYHHWAFGGVEDLISLAVVLVFAIAANHPFVQGNKRTAFAAMVFFLEDNGFRLTAADDPALASELVAVLERQLSAETFETSLRRVVTPAREAPPG